MVLENQEKVKPPDHCCPVMISSLQLAATFSCACV
jgi:hypothetical protein